MEQMSSLNIATAFDVGNPTCHDTKEMDATSSRSSIWGAHTRPAVRPPKPSTSQRSALRESRAAPEEEASITPVTDTSRGTRNGARLRCWTALTLVALMSGAGCSSPETVFDRPPSDTGSGDDVGSPDWGDLITPECTSDEDCDGKPICCDGTCMTEAACEVPGPCAEHGAVCTLEGGGNLEQQGEFYCVLAGADGPRCVAACDRAFSVDECQRGSFCLEVSAAEETVQLCLPGDCRSSEDCLGVTPVGGTCIPFGNGAGYCFPAGLAAAGATCGGEIRCATDHFCVTNPTIGGVCQPLCDMWGRHQAPCQTGTTCGYLTLGTGVCRNQTQQGREIAESCAPEGNWCASGVQCFDFRTGGEPLPICTAWCRPGHGDCRGRFRNQQGFCRTVFVGSDGEPIVDFGLCL